MEKLKRGENVRNRQLQTWLSEDEYAELEQAWQEQRELWEEPKDKPTELQALEKIRVLIQINLSKINCLFNILILLGIVKK